MDTISRARQPVIAVLALGPAAILLLSPFLSPWWKLFAASIGLLWFLKLCVLVAGRGRIGGLPASLYLTVWPGMDPEPLTRREEPLDKAGPSFVRGVLLFLGGLSLLLALVIARPVVSDLLTGWVAIAGLLLTIHFGISAILTSLMWLGGYKVRALFDRPLTASCLREFWTRRWNLPFVEMNRLLFMDRLRAVFGNRGAVLGAFAISGILHELAISYPSGAGWGGPLLYFLIQGALVLIESRLGIKSRVLTWISILGPLPLLFHEPFRATFMLPLIDSLNALLLSPSAEWYVDKGLWLLGGLQFAVLLASFQVPVRLRWPEELVKLSSFNRKLMWTQGLFIVTTIVAFASLTLLLHQELLRGDRAALAIAAFAGTFWTMRLLVDAIYYKHEDWPKGPQFVIGHTLLNCLFVLLATGYWGILLWHA